MKDLKGGELIRVAKFGGTSLALGESVKRAATIVLSSNKRQYVVVSAPGKRFREDTKITDMLYSAYDEEGIAQEDILGQIKERFEDIVRALHVEVDLEGIFSRIKESFGNHLGRDYAASRGEYVMGIIFSRYIGYEFIDAGEVIFFKEDGSFDEEKTGERLKQRLSGIENAVIPGFYGSMPNDTVKTFTRGGSDITGALVARAVGADIYENFTDVDGFMTADPNIVDSPQVMEQVTYDQLRALSSMGAVVLHEDSIYPVRFSGIPINIRNTFYPEGAGTVIVSRSDKKAPEITGIAGRTGYCHITVCKNMANGAQDIYTDACGVFAEQGVRVEYTPGGIDSVGFVVKKSELKGQRRRVLLGLCRRLCPEYVSIKDDIAAIAIVGEGINKGSVLWRMLTRLAEGGIIPELVIKPRSECCAVIGVDEFDYKRAICLLYEEVKDIQNKR